MVRIPFWTREARPTYVALVTFAMLVTGCFYDEGRGDLPELVISPESALQGDRLTVNLSAEGVRFDQCDPFTPEALFFESSSDDNKNVMKVHSVEVLVPDVVRASITIDPDAEIGSYAPVLRCDALTLFRGRFEVKGRHPLALSLIPSSGGAGARSKEIVLKVDGDFFIEESSYVIFGDGEQVEVAEHTVNDSQTMTVRVNISPSASLKEIDVAAITDGEVVHGVFEITDPISLTILSLAPDRVVRPASDEDTPRNYTLYIVGTEAVGFMAPESDAGLDDSTSSKVTFHPLDTINLGDEETELDGISAHNIRVNSATEITANIAVYNNANAGEASLRVTTQDRKAETEFWIEPAPEYPYLKLQYPPWPIHRGQQGVILIVQAFNMDLQYLELVSFPEQLECQVENFFVAGNTMTLEVSIGESFAEDSATLQVTTRESLASQTAEVDIPVTESIESRLVLKPSVIVQGARNAEVELVLRGEGSFDVDTPIEVLERSGLRLRNKQLSADNKLILHIDVADDAPTGQALLLARIAGEQIEAAITVVESGLVPWISFSPWATLQERSSIGMDLEVTGFDLSEDTTIFQFDDPGLRLEKLDINAINANRARLTIGVSPTARSDMSVLYVKEKQGQAAASFRVLEMPRARVVNVTPQQISRRQGGRLYTIAAQVTGITLDESIELQVMDDIGVGISGFDIDPNDDQKIEFTLDLDESGSGGWIGVLITSNWRSVVVPIHIIVWDDNESLTMKLSPDQVTLGSRAVNISAVLPLQAKLHKSQLEASTGLLGAYVSSPEFVSSLNARLFLDVAFDALPQGDGIPIFITALKGAAVGFVQVEDLSQYQVERDLPWQGTLSDHEVGVFQVASDPLPSLLYSSYQWPDYTNLTLELLAANGLDSAEQSNTGFLWLMDEADSQVVVSPGALLIESPSEVGVRPLWASTQSIIEPDDADPDDITIESVLASDPCNTPFLGVGVIDGALDVDRIAMGETSCRLKIVVLARGIAPRPWSTPDLWIELRSSSDELVDDHQSKGWPESSDPDPSILFGPQAGIGFLTMGAELASAGVYLVNIRRSYIIGEFSRDPQNPFIEIEVEPGISLDTLQIDLVDIQTGDTLESFSFLDQVLINDGIIVLGGIPMPEADIVTDVALLPQNDGFAIRLLESGIVVDAVQVGESIYEYGEGDPLPNEVTAPVFSRIQGIDTNDNLSDFMYGWVASVGE